MAALAVSQYLMKTDLLINYRQVTSLIQVIDLFDQASEKLETVQAPSNESGDFIVAVTAWQRGIAHTYMAQKLFKWLRKWVLRDSKPTVQMV